MRTYGRVYTGGVPGPWQVVQTDASGNNDAVWATTLCQVLKLQLGESPFFGNYGIPSEQAVLQQLFPDFYASLTQQQFSQYFAALTITRKLSPTPTYEVKITTNQGVNLSNSTGTLPQ